MHCLDSKFDLPLHQIMSASAFNQYLQQGDKVRSTKVYMHTSECFLYFFPSVAQCGSH